LTNSVSQNLEKDKIIAELQTLVFDGKVGPITSNNPSNSNNSHNSYNPNNPNNPYNPKNSNNNPNNPKGMILITLVFDDKIDSIFYIFLEVIIVD
jgi:hypothetical protein